MTAQSENGGYELLRTLPGDDVHHIMWRMADRFDLQMLVQSTRAVARGPVAQAVANGERNHHEWTAAKDALLQSFDESGITAAFMGSEHGGYLDGPKNLACSLIAFELAWVDGGASTCSLANNLALAPIHERGTQEQKDRYMKLSCPAAPGEDRTTWRGAFGLTEPIPYVGVETGMLTGKISVAEWNEDEEPMLKVEKRGRFITNMDFANFITAVVDTADERIKTSCMVILEEGDQGSWDRGAPTLKMVHQLSSTRDPIISVTVPASRIIGGYTIEDGTIVPNYSHGDVIEAVFKRTRITVGLMSAAKPLSAIEPVIRYQRSRFRGAEQVEPGTPRYEHGIQQKEDPLHRLVDVWAMGEASASLGFWASRVFDVLDPLEVQKDDLFAQQGISGARGQFKALRPKMGDAEEFIALEAADENERDAARFDELSNDLLTQFLVWDARGNVLCPACKLWNTGVGVNTMREAVSLMGGYGITEDCPGFLGNKWMDAQLEATYEGPESVQRRQMSATMTSPVYLRQFEVWKDHMKTLADERPAMGTQSVAAAMELWEWTLGYLQNNKDANGKRLYSSARQGVTFAMADAMGWILAAYSLAADVEELALKGPEAPTLAEGLEGVLNFMSDLSVVQSANSAGQVVRICTELLYGHAGQPLAHEMAKEFNELRTAVDESLCGARLAKDRAAESAKHVMIPEALDYPM